MTDELTLNLISVTRVPLEHLTLTRVPFGTLTNVSLHPDYSPMLFRQLRHYQNGQYLTG